MGEYYLISQLPSLDGISETSSIPISEESFLDLCHRFLGKKAIKLLDNLSLVPPVEFEKSASQLINAWNEGERNLRFALAKARADKMNKPFEAKQKDFPPELIKAVNVAIEIENPLEAEKFLLQYRLNFLEMQRPMDNFSEEYIFYYALKLKLLLRIRGFDAVLGEAEYKNIYNSIVNGDKLEAK